MKEREINFKYTVAFFRLTHKEAIKVLCSLRTSIFHKLDCLIETFSKGGKMCKVTGVYQLDYNKYKAVIWEVYRILSQFQSINLPLKPQILRYKPGKTLASNCFYAVTLVKEVLSVLRACIYHPQINLIRPLVLLERVLNEVNFFVAEFFKVL